MRLALFLIIIPFFSNATAVKIFHDREFTLPENCYMVVRGGHENDFTCPVSSDRFRSISFPLLEEVEEENKEHFDSLKSRLETEATDLRLLSFTTKEIEERLHSLEVWELNGITNYSYTICDYRSCIRISANEFSFIESLGKTISSEIIEIN
ncbi:hypothetical protein LJ739_11505 [Aestuariibacter halophilus]|uniref:Uncharacterized protein n=1 Tax=Fluctibacter halophilus TaxID=226011 RepID=A0ABS8GAX5_9ALTE|nr:hypothetical protein [Aestuariibacter halophilus]MCC2616869.1 hypothetical protein [Aestuariibacter halophilus]